MLHKEILNAIREIFPQCTVVNWVDLQKITGTFSLVEVRPAGHNSTVFFRAYHLDTAETVAVEIVDVFDAQVNGTFRSILSVFN